MHLSTVSTSYSNDTESADAENSDQPKSIPRWPTTPWPSFQLNPFAVKDDITDNQHDTFLILFCLEFKLPN